MLNGDTEVCHFLKANTLEWDEKKITKIFDKVDVKAILETRTP